jgi:hypothetical protein
MKLCVFITGNIEELRMFVFAIETCGKTVAFTKEVDRIMLDGILMRLPDDILYMRDNNGPLWDGVSPFTARLASASEELDYEITAQEYRQKVRDVGEEVFMWHLSNGNGENVLVVPPMLKRAA